MPLSLNDLAGFIAEIRETPSLAGALRPDTDLIDEVGLDSLELVQLLLKLEAAVGSHFDFDTLEFDLFRNSQALVDFMNSPVNAT